MIFDILRTNAKDRAVSPVIGVILMVAITVILAAVIGAFVLGLGDGLESSSGPQAQLSLETGDGNGEVGLIHQGGDSFALSDINFIVDGENSTGYTGFEVTSSDNDLSAGGSETVTVMEIGHDTEDDQEFDGEQIELTLVHEPSNSVIYSNSVTTGEAN